MGDINYKLFMPRNECNYQTGGSIKLWHNFKTGESDHHEGCPPDDKMKEYIPQLLAAQGLYDCYIGQGSTPMESMGKVLKASIPKDPS